MPMDEMIDISLRLTAAAVVGMVIGLNRDLKGKPAGMRTLGLVALASAVVSVAATHLEGMASHPDAMSRVVQGIIQGIMAGVGFIGAGVILRDREGLTITNLTTAAAVWITAALGIACALAAWRIAALGVLITFVVLAVGGPIERLFHRLLGVPKNLNDAR
jgi:putative Mg2+ transporter-C (MgtC) family protein